MAFAAATLLRERRALAARRFIAGTENTPERASNNKMYGLPCYYTGCDKN
jgi:hypothetical protein